MPEEEEEEPAEPRQDGDRPHKPVLFRPPDNWEEWTREELYAWAQKMADLIWDD